MGVKDKKKVKYDEDSEKNEENDWEGEEFDGDSGNDKENRDPEDETQRDSRKKKGKKRGDKENKDAEEDTSKVKKKKSKAKRGIVVFNFEDSLKKEKVEKEVKGRKRKVSNPIFFNYLTEDKFWMDFFEKCARNIFPDSFSFSDNTLYHKSKEAISKLQISEDTEILYIQEFFRHYGNIFSPRDQKMMKKKKDKIVCKSWGKLSPNNKQLMISKFIEKMNLNLKDKNKLRQVLTLGILMGLIKTKHVIIDDNEIKDITCLDIDDLTIDENFKPKRINIYADLERPTNEGPNFRKKYIKKIKGFNDKTAKETEVDIEAFSTMFSLISCK